MRRIEHASRPATIDDLITGDLIARVTRLDLASRKIFAGRMKGERRSKKRGESVEYADHRPYVSGDDLRHIDWNLYARLDRLIVKLFLEEQDLSLHLAIDASASMGASGGTKTAMAMRLAAALASIGLASRDRVAISVFGAGKPRHSGAYRGRTNLPALARFILARAKAVEVGTPGEPFEESMKSTVGARTGKGVMVVLSDFMQPEGCDAGLRALAAGGGFDVAPQAALDDGLLDLAVITSDSQITPPAVLRELQDPTNAENRYVHYWQLPEFLIETDAPLHCNLDGEPVQKRKLRFSVLPAHLSVVMA